MFPPVSYVNGYFSLSDPRFTSVFISYDLLFETNPNFLLKMSFFLKKRNTLYTPLSPTIKENQANENHL